MQKCRDLEVSQTSLIEEKNTVLDFLRGIGAACSESMNIDDILSFVMNTAKRATDATAGAIYLADQPSLLSAHVVDGLFPPMFEVKSNTESKWTSKQKYIHDIIKSYPIKLGDGILGKVFEDGQPRLIDCDGDCADNLVPKFQADFLQIKSVMAVPLKVRNKVIGVMSVVNKRFDNQFKPQDLAILESLAEQASVAITNAKLSIALAEKKQVEWELRVSEDIQKLLLPKELPHVHGYNFGAISQPVRSLGGDYYDIVKLDYDRYGMIIADVSGKGVPGALTIAIFRSLFRNYAVKFQSPARVLIEINNWLFGEIKEDMFITALYAILYPKEGRLVWSRAGHEPVLFYSKREQAVHVFSGMGLMMGMTFGKEFDSYLEENELNFGSGDVFMMYTDGVVEAQNRSGHEFGRDNLSQVLRSNASKDSKGIIHQVTDSVRNFSGSSNFQDDLTMLVLKKN